MRKTWLPCLLFILLSGPTLSQGWTEEFSRVDSFARTQRYDNNLEELALRLTRPFPRTGEKARALFRWITFHIRYDYKLFNSGKEVGPPECKPGKNCGQEFLKWEKEYLHRICKKGKALSDGYARLFDRLCEKAGIRSAMIEGYTKTKPYQVGTTGPVNHAWNALWLDSAWYVLDPTWAAGYCTEDAESGKLTGFVSSYEDYYWCTPFDEFTRNHFPKNGRWVLEPGYTKEHFAENPYFDPELISEIRLHRPRSGVIRARLGDTLHFRFSYTGSLERLQVNSNIYRNPDIWIETRVRKKIIRELDSFALRRQRYIPFTRQGQEYAFDFVVSSPTLYYLEILFDEQKRAMRFRVKVEE